MFITNASLSNWSADLKYTAYRRSSGSETIGSISQGDTCLKISTANGRTQVAYPVNGQGYYKVGWIETSSNSSKPSTPQSASYLIPCKTYAISTGHISVYDTVGGSPTANRYIDGQADLCTIEEIYTNDWCKVTYPTSSGTRTVYTPLSEFIKNASPAAWTANGKYTVYRRSNGTETIGSVSQGDACVKVAEENGKIQIMYPVSGQSYYKMGWIDVVSRCSNGSVCRRSAPRFKRSD